MKIVSHLDWNKPVRAFPVYYDLFGLGSATQGLFQFGGSVIGGLMNMRNTDKTNKNNKKMTEATNEMNYKIAQETNAQNYKIAQEANQLQRDMFNEQMDYTKATQQTEWDRADSALQRGTQDAIAAGISPLAIANSGGASSGSVVSQPSAPSMHTAQMQAAQMQAAMENPLLFDTNTITDGARALFEATMSDTKMSHESKEKALDRNLSVYQMSTQLQAVSDNLKTQLNAAADENEKNRLTQTSIAANQLAELIRSNKASERIAAEEQIDKAIMNITGGYGLRKQYFDNQSDYDAAMQTFVQEFSAINLGFSTGDPSKYSKSSGSNTSVSASGNIAGVAGAGASSSLGQSGSESVDYTLQDQAKLRAAYARLRFPVLKLN